MSNVGKNCPLSGPVAAPTSIRSTRPSSQRGHRPDLKEEDSVLLKRLPQRETDPGGIHWNFEKFLVDRAGAVIGRFAPDTKPEDDTIIRAIETALIA